MMNELITEDIKYVQIYFAEVHDNPKFDRESKSKYVRVLMCYLLTDGLAAVVDWKQLQEITPGFKYLTK